MICAREGRRSKDLQNALLHSALSGRCSIANGNPPQQCSVYYQTHSKSSVAIELFSSYSLSYMLGQLILLIILSLDIYKYDTVLTVSDPAWSLEQHCTLRKVM